MAQYQQHNTCHQLFITAMSGDYEEIAERAQVVLERQRFDIAPVAAVYAMYTYDHTFSGYEIKINVKEMMRGRGNPQAKLLALLEYILGPENMTERVKKDALHMLDLAEVVHEVYMREWEDVLITIHAGR